DLHRIVARRVPDLDIDVDEVVRLVLTGISGDQQAAQRPVHRIAFRPVQTAAKDRSRKPFIAPMLPSADLAVAHGEGRHDPGRSSAATPTARADRMVTESTRLVSGSEPRHCRREMV